MIQLEIIPNYTKKKNAPVVSLVASFSGLGGSRVMQVVAFSLLGATDGENVLTSKELWNFAGLWGGFPAVPMSPKLSNTKGGTLVSGTNIKH